MCVCELVLACVRVHVRVNASSLRGFSTSRRPAEGRRVYRKYIFKAFISSRACMELYEVPGGNLVDGLPPAPSWRNSEKGRDHTIRGLAQPILQFQQFVWAANWREQSFA